MDSIPGRIYRIAQAYLGAARDRLNSIDTAAQEELRRSLPRENPDYGDPNARYSAIPDPPAYSMIDDPFDRAAAKIDAARSANQARKAIDPEHYNFSESATRPTAPISPDAPPAPPDVVTTAYKMIGVPVGSPYPAVEKAVARLRERVAVDKFPAGSPEQTEAQQILAKIDDAVRVLQNALGVPVTRFDRLEL